MKACFICKNCESIVEQEKTEDHYKGCYDEDSQRRKTQALYWGMMDADEKHIDIEGA